MNRWFRHYAGMMRDEKLVAVSLKSKQPIERVLWVWGAILESAAEHNRDGKYAFDLIEAAHFLRADVGDVARIVHELIDARRISKTRIIHWKDRQFQSDSSASRTRRWREGKARSVTSPKRHGDGPYTETETETEKVKCQPQEEKVIGDSASPRTHAREARDGLTVIAGGAK